MATCSEHIRVFGKSRMTGMKLQAGDYPEFVEVDPSGRYVRYNEILGKGASKTVYRAFDDYEGIEVAWNQVKLRDFFRSSQDLERLYCEIHLLKSLNHKYIMKFYTSWVDTSKRNLNFITELFTSGTLRQYRQRYRRVNMRAVKHWCRQILMGLVYLHSRDPPVIHRDLKCDNIFINGNQGEVKIGDLGLAAILRKSKTVQCVGTPEFMAPEVYEEEYDELVDIYSFGMCILEMVTFEYPYSECTHPAQIYKKVTSCRIHVSCVTTQGTKPKALYKVKDEKIRQFIEKCLVTASQRLSAWELLKDPFLHIDGLGPLISEGDIVGMGHILRQSRISPQLSNGSITTGFSHGLLHESELEYKDDELEIHGIELFSKQEEEHFANMDITIKGRRKEDGGVFIMLRISDKDGRSRNIYFPFDVEADTALSVATEMVGELDITDYEVPRIAEMIDGEVSSLVPGWKMGPGIDDSPRYSSKNLCQYCASNVSSWGSLLDYVRHRNPGSGNLQPFYCSNLQCVAMCGRFEEITYQMEGPKNYHEEGAHFSSSSQDVQSISAKEVAENDLWDLSMNSGSKRHQYASNFADENGDEIQPELAWLRGNYQSELWEYENRQSGDPKEILYPSSSRTDLDQKIDDVRRECSSSCASWRTPKDRQMKSFHQANNCSFHIHDDERQVSDFLFVSNCAEHEDVFDSLYPERRRPKAVSAGNTLSPILRTRSLPVDVVNV